MNLTHKRFVDLGVESDIEIMRREVYTLQNRLNSLSKLRKDLDKASAEEMENYVLESGLGEVYAAAAEQAKTLNRAQYKQFIQEGGLSKLIGAHHGKKEDRESEGKDVEDNDRGHPAPSSPDQQSINGSEDTKEA
jgi:hypothetical protein